MRKILLLTLCSLFFVPVFGAKFSANLKATVSIFSPYTIIITLAAYSSISETSNSPDISLGNRVSLIVASLSFSALRFLI